MKIVIHDFAGHAFQVELSRALADLGHEVSHVYFANDPGPKGAMRNYVSTEGLGSVEMISVGPDIRYRKGSFFLDF